MTEKEFQLKLATREIELEELRGRPGPVLIVIRKYRNATNPSRKKKYKEALIKYWTDNNDRHLYEVGGFNSSDKTIRYAKGELKRKIDKEKFIKRLNRMSPEQRRKKLESLEESINERNKIEISEGMNVLFIVLGILLILMIFFLRS